MKFKVMLILAMLAASLIFSPPCRADAGDFASRVDLAPLRTLSVQDNQTLKTLDTFARQTIYQITGHSSIDGHDALFTLLDMSFHPDAYVDRKIIKIANVPIRMEFRRLKSIDTAEQERIVHDGLVSLAFLEQPDVLEILRDAQAASVNKTKAINQLMMARGSMEEICLKERGFIPAAIFPPPAIAATPPASVTPSAANEILWHRPWDWIGAMPELADSMRRRGLTLPDAPPNYNDKNPLIADIFTASANLLDGWTQGDSEQVNRSAQTLALLLPTVNAADYPTHAKRMTEVVYNRFTKMTIPGSAMYMIAFVMFLMATGSGIGRLRRWALAAMIVAFAIHTTGIAIRWWLVGDIFPPIKNEFESVMFSAWFGALIGMILETRYRNGIFGAAASFVGGLALVAIFTVPFVTGTEIGGDIERVQGILMSYWLYIHVTMVTTAYALIAMGFVLSSWWLIRYYREKTPAFASASAMAARSSAPVSLAALDMCNLVVLQLAFWILGAGIVFGAIWADQSWGRPWGWDSKETFALITWIVYLIVVHVRVVANNKGWWTAVLGCCGFFVMLFNWIGVNFFLVGLHSYA